jgi:hypothetical protein
MHHHNMCLFILVRRVKIKNKLVRIIQTIEIKNIKTTLLNALFKIVFLKKQFTYFAHTITKL